MRVSHGRLLCDEPGLTLRQVSSYCLSVELAGGTTRAWTATEVDILEAVKSCCERWGIEKVTVDDIAKQSAVSRATLYRVFPGGRDVIFEALRVYELDHFFAVLRTSIEGAATLEDLLVSAVTCATIELNNDEHLAIMLASEPGAVVGELTVEGLPRIARVASAYLVPFVNQFLPLEQSHMLIDVVVRLVISYFLSPADFVDLTDEDSARAFLTPFVPSELLPNPQID